MLPGVIDAYIQQQANNINIDGPSLNDLTNINIVDLSK